MTLFMTSCGGKKSSRNCGSILATTRASLGKPFRILPTTNPGRANDEGDIKQLLQLYVKKQPPSNHLGNYKPMEVKDSESCKFKS